MAPNNTNDSVAAVPWTETHQEDGVRLSASVLLHLKLTRLGLCSNRPAIRSSNNHTIVRRSG